MAGPFVRGLVAREVCCVYLLSPENFARKLDGWHISLSHHFDTLTGSCIKGRFAGRRVFRTTSSHSWTNLIAMFILISF